MFLEKYNGNKKVLSSKTVMITGGGGGIGFEASRAFSYMGAKVIIAEIDTIKGKQAQARINNEFNNQNVDFYQIDITDDHQVDDLYAYILDKYAHLDVIIHNAAVVPMGSIEAVSIADWDLSYQVNLRAPVRLTQKFLPSMKSRGGIIVFIPSAPITAYMSAYEIFKSAQVELCDTLVEEISGTNVITYSIAPGFVKTDTAIKSVEIVASSLGIAVEDFYQSLEEVALDVELAGAGYAVSVANAEKYDGQMTSSLQVLLDHELIIDDTPKQDNPSTRINYERLTALFTRITDIHFDQYQGWKKKKLFQRQFILSDFKKQMGFSAENFNNQLENLLSQIHNNQWSSFLNSKEMLIKWKNFYLHQKTLLEGYEKDKNQLASDTALLNTWIEILQEMIDILE